MAENRAQHAGRMVVIHGCMFAGKTARLIDRLLAAQASGVDVRAFKHRLDVRYDPYRLMTHDGRSFPSTPVEDARELVARIRPSLTGRGQGGRIFILGGEPGLMGCWRQNYFSHPLRAGIPSGSFASRFACPGHPGSLPYRLYRTRVRHHDPGRA